MKSKEEFCEFLDEYNYSYYFVENLKEYKKVLYDRYLDLSEHMIKSDMKCPIEAEAVQAMYFNSISDCGLTTHIKLFDTYIPEYKIVVNFHDFDCNEILIDDFLYCRADLNVTVYTCLDVYFDEYGPCLQEGDYMM